MQSALLHFSCLMEHFAILAPPFPSHIRALEVLAGELIDHGHLVTLIHQQGTQLFLSDRRINFVVVGALTHQVGTLDAIVRRVANPDGIFGLRAVIADVAASTAMLCKEVPDLIKPLGITVIIADQMEAAGGLIAQYLQLPFVSVACALPVNREPAHPLPVMPWSFATSARAIELNKTSARIYDWLMQPHARVISLYAKNFGLSAKHTLADCLSPFAQISQTTASFDFPRTMLPKNFYHAGPLRSKKRRDDTFEITKDVQRPFVFASLGTLQGGRLKLFTQIARACKAAGFQLLIAHCNHLDALQEQRLKSAGATWVTGFVNQQAAIKIADVVVTHGGLNTVMDSLAAGTPMLVLPIAFDQPGVAARVVYAGAGLSLLPRWTTTLSVTRALRQLVEVPAFAQHARRIGLDVAAAGGAQEAARIVLSAVGQMPTKTPGVLFARQKTSAESMAYAC